MYKLKDAVKRGSALLGVGVLLTGVGASVLPNFASADTLNPLTKRSLTLTSSSPGWAYTDGSGNSLYAPPNSGANGQKTGNLFSFDVSTNTASGADTNAPDGIQTMSFQYCVKSAGDCVGPGDDSAATVPGTDDSSHSDLNVATSSPAEVGSSDFGTVVGDTSDSTNPNGVVSSVPGVTDPLTTAGHPLTTGQYAAHAVAGNFVVYWDDAGTWTYSGGWSMRTLNVENTGSSATLTGKKNYIVLSNHGGLSLPANANVKVDFFGTTNNYITNPGAGYFFVKINTYGPEDIGATGSPGANQMLDAGLMTTQSSDPTNVIDGGVTVANVMNQSIQITTKVLETMQFSVGTVDPDTLNSGGQAAGNGVQTQYETAEGITNPNDSTTAHATHQTCDPVLTRLNPTTDPEDVLALGDQTAESSLSTDHTYSTHSYWRLSSNSSAGATVYYSGHTLSNTEQDQIAPVGVTAASPRRGAAQFGVALDNSGTLGTNDTANAVDYSFDASGDENAADNGITSLSASTATDVGSNPSFHDPQLYPLVPTTNYGGGTGTVDNASPATTFAFDANSDTIPAAVATESTQVVDCVTAKVRYMANIAATTPAGIYTTKINWIAAPQY